MPKYGLLIDYEFCVGCRACEVACKQEHGRPAEEYGIFVNEPDSEKTGGIKYFIPFPTDKCNLCGKRIADGKDPACVHSCWANVMKFGRIEELAEQMQKKPRQVLWVPH
jgi:anaerobic dimethyl sulfoxide reductase subunit B (iron-sulfur subunit)